MSAFGRTTLTGQCIWITGASSGLGKALAEQLCDMGNFVIVSSRSEAALKDMSLRAKGCMCALPFDVAGDEKHLSATKIRLQEITDYIDMVICCAGYCEYETTLDFSPAMYKRVFDVNFLGCVNTLHLAMPFLKKSERKPSVVLIGSLSSALVFPHAEAYGASKAALEYFAQALQVDTHNLPLHVTLVRPGFVQTPMTEKNDFPMPWMISSERAADRIIQGLRKNKKCIDFPRRLSWSLRLLGKIPFLWLHFFAPRLSRTNSLNWPVK